MTTAPPKPPKTPKPRHVSAGAVLLSRVGATREEIGARVGVSDVSVVFWIQGSTKPSPEKRRLLLAAYGIPPESWDRDPGPAETLAPALPGLAAPGAPGPPSGAPEALPTPSPARSRAAAPPPLPALPATVTGKAAVLESLVVSLIQSLQAPGSTSTPGERAKIAFQASSILDKLARVQGEYNVERRILSLLAWKRIEAACEEALRPFPDAAKALQSAIIKLDQTN